VWGYFSVKSGGGIHEFSDSQFGHLFAKGDSREAAIRAMVVALRDVRVRGEIHTIIDYAVDMLTSPVGVCCLGDQCCVVLRGAGGKGRHHTWLRSSMCWPPCWVGLEAWSVQGF
jgi:hypothetical protein